MEAGYHSIGNNMNIIEKIKKLQCIIIILVIGFIIMFTGFTITIIIINNNYISLKTSISNNYQNLENYIDKKYDELQEEIRNNENSTNIFTSTKIYEGVLSINNNFIKYNSNNQNCNYFFLSNQLCLDQNNGDKFILYKTFGGFLKMIHNDIEIIFSINYNIGTITDIKFFPELDKNTLKLNYYQYIGGSNERIIINIIPFELVDDINKNI